MTRTLSKEEAATTTEKMKATDWGALLLLLLGMASAQYIASKGECAAQSCTTVG